MISKAECLEDRFRLLCESPILSEGQRIRRTLTMI